MHILCKNKLVVEVNGQFEIKANALNFADKMLTYLYKLSAVIIL